MKGLADHRVRVECPKSIRRKLFLLHGASEKISVVWVMVKRVKL